MWLPLFIFKSIRPKAAFPNILRPALLAEECYFIFDKRQNVYYIQQSFD